MYICFSLQDDDRIKAEIMRQDRYLQHYKMKRIAVSPDENCLFAAVCMAGKLDMDGHDLRREITEYIMGKMNDFYTFLLTEQYTPKMDVMASMTEELQMMRGGGTWVGYEVVMALSRHLDVEMVVTSGGTSDNDGVRTHSFYFGEERPEKHIHIVWVSAGFYDAVVPSTGGRSVERRPVEINLVKDGRHPSHRCQCKWTCDCSRWQSLYNFPEDVDSRHEEPPAECSSSAHSPSPSTNSTEQLKEAFGYLKRNASVIKTWKFIVRNLDLNEVTITEIDEKPNTNLSTKTYEALMAWREQSERDVTIRALQNALRKENLVLAAGMTVFIKIHVSSVSTQTTATGIHNISENRWRLCHAFALLIPGFLFRKN